MRASVAHDDELDVLLRSADPSRSFTTDHRRLTAAVASAGSATRVPRRVRSRVWVALAVAAALGLGATAPAVADHILVLSRTGQFGTAGTEGDSSEWLTSEGSDFAEVIDATYPEWLPLPPAVDANAFRRETVELLSAGSGYEQVSGAEVSFEHQARCAWVYEWLAADTVADTPRATAAAAMLQESAHWPATVASDGGGFVDHLLDVANAAATGDRTVVEYQEQSECGAIPSARVE